MTSQMIDERLSFLRQSSSNLPIQCTFEHRVPDASGLVDLQYWPAKAGSTNPPEQLTLFILGNPGLLDYYLPFLNHLHSLLPPTHAILSTSHIGQSLNESTRTRPLDLPRHLASKVELVQAVQSYLGSWAVDTATSSAPRLALMGHSVGSWLSCEVMKQVQGIHAGYLLFPTLGWIADSWNGRTLWPMFKTPFKQLLPLASPLIRPILPFTTFPSTTLSFLKSPSTIEHVLAMAKSEMSVIKDLDIEWYRSQAAGGLEDGRGLFGAWAGGNLDGWVGKDGHLVREYLGGDDGGRIQILEGVPHAFCLTQEHSEIVAKTVASWVIPSVKPPSTETSQAPPPGSSIGPM